jgi:hypothetical protein
MLRSLKEVQADDGVVGFYQVTTLGAFFNQTLVDTQAIHQEKLRHGGVVIVHGTSTSIHQFNQINMLFAHPRSLTSITSEPCVPRLSTISRVSRGIYQI